MQPSAIVEPFSRVFPTDFLSTSYLQALALHLRRAALFHAALSRRGTLSMTVVTVVTAAGILACPFTILSGLFAIRSTRRPRMRGVALDLCRQRIPVGDKSPGRELLQQALPQLMLHPRTHAPTHPRTHPYTHLQQARLLPQLKLHTHTHIHTHMKKARELLPQRRRVLPRFERTQHGAGGFGQSRVCQLPALLQ